MNWFGSIVAVIFIVMFAVILVCALVLGIIVIWSAITHSTNRQNPDWRQ